MAQGQAELDFSQLISVIWAGHLGGSSSTTHLSCTQRAEQPSPSKQNPQFLWVHRPGHGSACPGDSVVSMGQNPLGHPCCAPPQQLGPPQPSPLLQKGLPWAPSRLRNTLLPSTQPRLGDTPANPSGDQVPLG